MRADAGVVISASHNPYQDNGIKFFSRDGFKLPDELELKIEELIFSQKIDSLRPMASEVGKAFRIDDAKGRYIVFLKNTFPRDLDLQGLHIVLDCAHGAAYKVAPAVLEELGAEVMLLGVTPNGTNINAGCGSLHPEVISEAVKEHRAHLGIALDGDADRVIFVDENGHEVDGDHIMAICATRMLQEDRLPKKTAGGDGHEQYGAGHRHAAGRRAGGENRRRRPLRGGRDAARRLQSGRRAVGAHDLSRPQHHRRRHDLRPAGPGDHAAQRPDLCRNWPR